MNKIVFICQVFYPDTTSTSQLFTGLLEEMAEKDCHVIALCAFPSGFSGDVKALPRRENRNGIEIRRCGFRIDHKKNLWHRAMGYFGFLAHCGWHLLLLGRPMLLFGVTNPPFLAQLLWLISMIRRIPYQYMLLDAYPEALVALGMKRKSLTARLWFWANKVAYRRAEKLVVLGRDMIPILVNNYGISESEIVYVPHWSAVELQQPSPIENSAMLKRVQLEGKHVVQYSGNMGMWHDINSLVEAAAHLQDDPSIHFLFIGNGARLKEAQELSKKIGLDNLTWHDFVPIEQLQDSLSACHVALISLRAGFEGVAVPSKLYGILASGRALIAQVPRESEVAYVLEEEQCGIVVEPGDTQGIADAVRELASDPQRVEEMGHRAFKAYTEKYLQVHAIEAFRKLWDLIEADGERSSLSTRRNLQKVLDQS